MKKFILICVLMLFILPAFAADETKLIEHQTIQSRIDDCGSKILNSNKIEKRVVFVYSDADKSGLLEVDKDLTRRQVVVYAGKYKFVDSEDELAAVLSREIAIAARTYDGMFNGSLRALQIKAAPKKFEIVADKIAVDYMVKAGYNPLGLITYIQKTSPQRRFDMISNKNLTSKRLAMIYEYIYMKYPYFLVNNTYLDNVHYQNFLLTSVENRRLLHEKIKNHSKGKVKYE